MRPVLKLSRRVTSSTAMAKDCEWAEMRKTPEMGQYSCCRSPGENDPSRTDDKNRKCLLKFRTFLAAESIFGTAFNSTYQELK